MARTHYRNGDPITLLCGCDGCSPSMIQGVLVHERGCPDAWRDSKRECEECGFEFTPQERHQSICQGCIDHAMNPYDEDDFDEDDDYDEEAWFDYLHPAESDEDF